MRESRENHSHIPTSNVSKLTICHEVLLGRGLSSFLEMRLVCSVVSSGGLATETDIVGHPAPGRSLYTECTPYTHLHKLTSSWDRIETSPDVDYQ